MEISCAWSMLYLEINGNDDELVSKAICRCHCDNMWLWRNTVTLEVTYKTEPPKNINKLLVGEGG